MVEIHAAEADAQHFGWVPARTEQYAIARMGTVMPVREARRGIAFRPFEPPRRTIVTALLPAFHGDDTRRNRGIGIEYADISGRLYGLAQWPGGGGKLDGFAALANPDPDCPSARNFSRGTTPSGIVWSTPHGIIMSLAADGKTDARTLRAEWKKLIRRGACR